MLLALQGAARCCKVLLGCCCQSGVRALERACWCRCRVPLQGTATGCCKVLLGCCCQSGVRAFERACWCRCRVPLQGTANVTSTIVKGTPLFFFFKGGGVCFAIVNRKSKLFPKGFCKVLTILSFLMGSDGIFIGF